MTTKRQKREKTNIHPRINSGRTNDRYGDGNEGKNGAAIKTRGFWRIPMRPLAHPIPVYNADGTQNIGGPLKEWARITLTIGTHEEEIDFRVSDLGKTNVFLGYD